jgi:hypothetical protein
MIWTLPALALALTMMAAANAIASPIAAAPCATSASIERGTAAMRPFLQASAGAPQATGMVLLDCRVQRDQKLRCEAPNHTPSQYDLRGAALAFAGELEVCPSTQRHLMFPLVFRADESATQSPSP